MLRKFNTWWEINKCDWVNVITVIAIVSIFLNIFGFVCYCGVVSNYTTLLHDIEVQLTAHGVDWALYTPIP